MVQLIKKIKDTAGGFHSWWESDKGIIRKPNNKDIIKVGEIKTETIMPTTIYSLKKTILKMVKYFVLFTIPFVKDAFPNDVLNLTLGTVLVGIVNWIKVKFALRIP